MAKAARTKSGRFVKKNRASSGGRRRRRTKANYMGVGALVNHRRRRRKSNPSFGGGGMTIMGVTLPPAERILFAGAGALAPEVIEMLVQEFAPEFVASESGQMAVQIGSYVVPPMLALMFSKRAAADVAFGELINLSIVSGRKMLESFTGLTPVPVAQPLKGYLPRLPAPGNSTARQLSGYVRRPNGLRGYRTSPDRLAKRYPERG